uniref:Uncharacterized protein n=1 Tax=Arundo donax TaxID=35708 RepID=A0A0A8Y8E7_ARUDO
MVGKLLHNIRTNRKCLRCSKRRKMKQVTNISVLHT